MRAFNTSHWLGPWAAPNSRELRIASSCVWAAPRFAGLAPRSRPDAALRIATRRDVTSREIDADLAGSSSMCFRSDRSQSVGTWTVLSPTRTGQLGGSDLRRDRKR